MLGCGEGGMTAHYRVARLTTHSQLLKEEEPIAVIHYLRIHVVVGV